MSPLPMFADARGPGVLGFRGGHFAGMLMVATGRRVYLGVKNRKNLPTS